MENENLISVYLKLLNVLECPVCLEYLTKPVALCNEGHALCSKCKSNIHNCPLCRNPISQTRGLIVDQVIETLLYPCYKMMCGSLLKRADAEAHDQTCSLEAASDKQAVLHNNLLKNIEENFASFIVQPEIVKDTRTVGTMTGQVKTSDVRVQTALPFSVKLSESAGEELGPTETKGNSGAFKLGPSSSGISIASAKQNMNDSEASKMGFSFAPNSAVQSSVTISMNPNNFNNCSNEMNINSNTQGLNFNRAFKIGTGLWNGNNSLATPFNSSTNFGQNSEGKPSGSRKPSTKLDFGSLGINSKPRETLAEIGPSSNTQNGQKRTKLARPTSGLFINSAPSTSSCTAPLPVAQHNEDAAENVVPLNSGESQNENLPRNKPSTNLFSSNLNSANVLNSLTNNNGPFALSDTNIKKRPSTNLCGLTTPA